MSANAQVSKVAKLAVATIVVATSTPLLAQDAAARAVQQRVEAEIAKQYARRGEIEAEVKAFGDESDAVRAAAGEARAPETDDCALQGTVDATTYVCPAPRVARDRFKSALLTRGWIATQAPTPASPYVLDAFRKGVTLAFFVCVPDRKDCLLELQHQTR